ncbi:MAG: ferrous iron transport protein B [Candidatus Hydrogenedentota bacterium]
MTHAAEISARDIVIAVVGNPNVGKTTLFNSLTGLSQSTGNYPGVTVERKSGTLELSHARATLIDLPGTYSLAARSPDEILVIDVLLGQMPGERDITAILAVVDATNLERNLYLVSQLKELGKPMVIALNMMDLAEKMRLVVQPQKLSEALGMPVVPICAHKRVGYDALREALTATITSGSLDPDKRPVYPEKLGAAVDSLWESLNARSHELGRSIQRPEAFRVLVDRDGYAEQRIGKKLAGALKPILEDHRKRASENGPSLHAIEAKSRYAWVREAVAAGLERPRERIITSSDRLDSIVTHKVYGTVLFVVIMAIVFQSIYQWAGPLMDLIDGGLGWLGKRAGSVLPEGALQSLVVDGIFGGVAAVVVFLPQILILSLFIALLEDCGYMARAAFLMDRLLSRCGLSGQSFIPLLSSFACAIPGVMATRTIANRRDRFATILVAPLMSCSARLPVYIIMIGAFVPDRTVLGGVVNVQGLTLFLMYCLGVAIAIPVAWLLKKTLLKGDPPPFVLELPSYKTPQVGTVARKVWRQGMEFLKRAGTLIFAITIIVWALAYFPRSESISESFDAQREAATAAAMNETDLAEQLANLDNEEASAHVENSYFARMGHAIEPVVRPLGWDWRIGMATIASFPAREIIVATLGTIFKLGSDVSEEDEVLRNALREATRADGSPLFTLPVALSVMVFFALCCQCGATLVVIRRETQSWRWPAFTFAYMTALAYVAALVVYQAGTAAGLGG